MMGPADEFQNQFGGTLVSMVVSVMGSGERFGDSVIVFGVG